MEEVSVQFHVLAYSLGFECSSILITLMSLQRDIRFRLSGVTFPVTQHFPSLFYAARTETGFIKTDLSQVHQPPIRTVSFVVYLFMIYLTTLPISQIKHRRML